MAKGEPAGSRRLFAVLGLRGSKPAGRRPQHCVTEFLRAPTRKAAGGSLRYLAYADLSRQDAGRCAVLRSSLALLRARPPVQ